MSYFCFFFWIMAYSFIPCIIKGGSLRLPITIQFLFLVWECSPSSPLSDLSFIIFHWKCWYIWKRWWRAIHLVHDLQWFPNLWFSKITFSSTSQCNMGCISSKFAKLYGIITKQSIGDNWNLSIHLDQHHNIMWDALAWNFPNHMGL